jgi:hypothetical protein
VSNSDREELVIDLEVAMQIVLREHGVLLDRAMENTVTKFAHTVAELSRRDPFSNQGLKEMRLPKDHPSLARLSLN